MCSGVRRKYSEAVPYYMRDRPKEMVQKCMARMSAGDAIQLTKVKEKENGIYEVEAESTSTPYCVTLDPSCTCHDYDHHPVSLQAYLCSATTAKPEQGINPKLDPLLRKQKTTLSAATYCREMLKELISLTYKVQAVEYLENFGCLLGLKVKEIKDRVETGGITLEPGSQSAS